jgi:hypothetical protein
MCGGNEDRALAVTVALLLLIGGVLLPREWCVVGGRLVHGRGGDGVGRAVRGALVAAAEARKGGAQVLRPTGIETPLVTGERRFPVRARELAEGRIGATEFALSGLFYSRIIAANHC